MFIKFTTVDQLCGVEIQGKFPVEEYSVHLSKNGEKGETTTLYLALQIPKECAFIEIIPSPEERK